MSMAVETYTAQSLAAVLGITRQAVDKRARSESWQSLPRAGRGGGKLWIVSSMPPATRDAIASAMLREARAAVVSTSSNASAQICATVDTTSNPAHAPEWKLASDRERAVATARLAFVREIERLSGLVGKE